MNFTLDTLAKGIKNPTDAFYFIYSRVDKKVESYFYTVNNALTSDVFSDGVSMMERDWDNLIILDACRYDNFSAINTLSGTLEKEISKGSSSSEFIEKNFSRGNFHDTIYVSANPFANELQNDTFYLKKLATELWDYELNTVHPSDLRELGLRVHKKHPNKRLIIHFMQPHAPYLGSKAEKLRDRVDLRGYNIFIRDESTELNRDGHNLWNAVKKGYISDREIREGYNQTLKIALDEVSELVDDLDGKSVITADHGEMLGERVLSVKKSYGHPSGIKTRELREIPWFVIPGNRRRKIVSETPLNSEQMNDDEVENRLQALGYKPDRRQDDPK